jgi:cytochrome c oxidase cbb3-type subunit 4
MMDTYSIFREIADSWVLLAMFLFFLFTVLWVFRPGSRELHKDAAQAPFRNETPPQGAEE